jgi:hypothetical protein
MPSRRRLLQMAAHAAAAPAASAFFSSWFQEAAQHHGRPPAPPQPPFLRNYQPQFFDREDFAALQACCEILIPTDDTPGAREAHCAHYIDFVLNASTGFAPEVQRQWRAAMATLRQAGFHAADAARRQALVEEMSRPERDPNARHPAYSAYRLIKQQNAFAFYTSRAGLIEALDYRGNRPYARFPACTHPEHRVV